jgi:site-specific recombinase XerD
VTDIASNGNNLSADGPFAVHITPFLQWAREQGYEKDALLQRKRISIGFGGWLKDQKIEPAEVSNRRLAQYLRFRVGQSRPYTGDARALTQFRDFLIARGVLTAERSDPEEFTAADRLNLEFRRYLRDQQLLAQPTILNYAAFTERFLKSRYGTGPAELHKLSAQDVVRFVRLEAPRLHRKRAKLMTTALRSFLRYGCFRGDLKPELAMAVPAVANWSRPLIPRAIAPDQVRKVLAHVNRNTIAGRRDYAILLLLARLGLRAGEIVHMELQDIDWRAGCLQVRGKGGTRTQLPLPKEVGDAIVEYLRNGRPQTSLRRVFICADGPIRGLSGAGTLCAIVERAVLAAGVVSPSKGAHQFRHGLASEMLRHGASLPEIGQVLGHRSPEATRIYAKVDIEALRKLALPWPL